ncbi:hypothetical protein LSUB1_G000636 [Lachnellula subtilissima]|uniref:Uncharacterized protein n=1 Tax=Lachnellula subtilissima TaxID=602034 RepID=A0A8H8RYJ0_9HELO|nr:hypothetical protein LSUB1_G000636 [Lachnellula subtilissima]
MAKTTSKRKSESALPIGRSKLRQTVNQEESESAHGDNSGDELFVEDQPVATRHVKKKKKKTCQSEPARLVRADEYEEDEGRTESQQFLALVEFESKKKRMAGEAAAHYMDQFVQRLGEGEQGLKKKLQDLRTAAPKEDEKFLERFSEAFAASRPRPPPAKDAAQGKESSDLAFVSLYKQSNNLSAAAKDIIKMFESANQLTSNFDISGLLDNDWGDEDGEAARLLGVGRDVGIHKYQSLLTASAEPPPFDEEVTAMADMIYKKDEGLVSTAWGKIAKKQERSAKKLLKSLPQEIV